MSFALRDYQERAVAQTIESLREHRSTLVVMPTGSGKTVVMAHVAGHFIDKGRILVLAHREELIFQAAKTFEEVLGEHAEIEMGEYWAGNSMFASRVVCSTIQTQIAGKNGGRMSRFEPNDFSFVFLDEGHHGTADSYKAVINQYLKNPNLRLASCTATPDRADEEALGQVFEDVAFEYDLLDAVNDGWLVPIQQQAVHVEGLDYSAIRSVAGELNGKDLGEVLEFEQNLHGMTTPVLELCGDKKTLIFTATVGQAQRMAEILNRHKPGSAEFVSGETPKEYRRSLLDRYSKDSFQYLVNCAVASEGFDEPGIHYCVMGRPTKSRALYAQQVGRATRPLPETVDGLPTPEARRAAIAASDKPCCIVVDFVGNAGRHKLIHATDILGGKYPDESDDDEPTVVELAQQAVEEAGRQGKPADIASELVKAEREIDRRRRMREEARQREQIKLRSDYSTRKIDPFDALDIVPGRIPGWHKGRMATVKQRDYIESQGYNLPEGLNFVHASQIISRIMEKPTPKQVKILKWGGFPLDVTRKQASEFIDAFFANDRRRLPPPEHAELVRRVLEGQETVA